MCIEQGTFTKVVFRAKVTYDHNKASQPNRWRRYITCLHSRTFPISADQAFTISILLSAITHFYLGAGKVFVTHKNPILSGLKMLQGGGLAAGVAYTAGLYYTLCDWNSKMQVVFFSYSAEFYLMHDKFSRVLRTFMETLFTTSVFPKSMGNLAK